jgi:hypothetical protein
MKHKDIDQAMAAKERAELYFAENPRSPAAVRRPELSIRSGRWVALLGRSNAEGIVGVGSTAETALRAFDAQYLAARRPPIDRGALGAEVRPSSEAHRNEPRKNGNNGHHPEGGEMADMRLRLVRKSLPVFRRFLGAHLDPRL